MPITINLAAFGDGTYSIEDDGTIGNGTSVIRNALGTIVSTFVHGSDSVTILSRAGQSFNVNLFDAVGGDFTIGSLSTAASRPDNVWIGSLAAGGTVTLTANGEIGESGNDPGIDLTANTLLLLAGAGIGQRGRVIETRVSFLEAESASGGINLLNDGGLVIGGVNSTLRGLFTGASGDIVVTTFGSIFLNDETGLECVHSAGNATLTALNATSDITSNVDHDTFFVSGNLNLVAGRDILLGTFGANYDNDVRAGGSININAARDFRIDGSSNLAADDLGLASGGGVTITAGRNILVDDFRGTAASVGVSGLGGGGVVLTTGVGGSLNLGAASASAVFAGSGGVIVNSDMIVIESDSGITTTGNGTVTLRNATFGHEIRVGNPLIEYGLALELSDAELDRIFTQTLIIGGANAGQVTVYNPLTLNMPNLVLMSGSDILIDANITNLGSVTLRAGNDIVQSAGTTIQTGIFNAFIDLVGPDAGGVLTLNGTVNATTRTLDGANEGDRITGTGQDDILNGGGGNDLLDGGAGADRMLGSTGDDTYIVDAFGDQVLEAAGQGDDRVFATTSYQLGAGASVETLASRDNSQTVAMNLLGNELNNIIFGNNGANFIEGGAGADIMTAFGGDDVYAVDNAGDVVIELAGQGNDALYTTFSYILGFQSSVELLASRDNSLTTAMSLFGNELNNTILGNNGANYLDGLTGADIMAGYSGDDTYIVDNAGDVVVEEAGRGSDAIFTSLSFVLSAGSSVETIGARDNSLTVALNITGNELGQSLSGNNGANLLDGKGGTDTLVGFAGADTFAFTTAIGTGNVDLIADFVSGTDKVALDDAVFTAIGAPGALAAGAFVTGTAAADANDRIIYNAASGQLYYDADGNGAGAAVLFATLQGNPVLAASDFMVI
jgi:Ca2+-binding RTX toxin-like protein